MAALKPEGRIALGRYHAFRFAYCTKSEGRNRTQGLKIATAFAGMASSPRYADMTVARYLELAERVHEANGKAPWFDPWRIKVFAEATDYRGNVRGPNGSDVLREQGAP